MQQLPQLLVTMGDVAGIGPEIIARAWPGLCELCRPVVVGDRNWLERALRLAESGARIRPVDHPAEADAAPDLIPFIRGSSQDLSAVTPARVSAAAGQAAYDFLCRAIDLTL